MPLCSYGNFADISGQKLVQKGAPLPGPGLAAWGPGVTEQWRGRGAGVTQGVARAVGNWWAWVARAWRGHGAGVARACPVKPAPEAWAATLVCQKNTSLDTKIEKLQVTFGKDRAPIFPTPPKNCSLARNQLPNALRGTPYFFFNSLRAENFVSANGAYKLIFGEDLCGSGGPTGLPKITSPDTKPRKATCCIWQDRTPICPMPPEKCSLARGSTFNQNLFRWGTTFRRLRRRGSPGAAWGGLGMLAFRLRRLCICLMPDRRCS
eukprot:gene13855-biopygen5063